MNEELPEFVEIIGHRVRVVDIENPHIRIAFRERFSTFLFNHGEERGPGWNEHRDSTGYRESPFNWGKHDDWIKRRANYEDKPENYSDGEYSTAWQD